MSYIYLTNQYEKKTTNTAPFSTELLLAYHVNYSSKYNCVLKPSKNVVSLTGY